MSQGDGQDGGSSNHNVVIIASTVASVVGLAILVAVIYLCRRNRRRRALKLFRRGATPIGDDEIETWKVTRSLSRNNMLNEKSNDNYTRRNPTAGSQRSHKKVGSNNTIQYQQASTRPSLDAILSPTTPRSFVRKPSLDAPRIPPSAVVAVAPNARTGLTDETIPGDVPYVQTPKRQPSKLSKAPPVSHRPSASRGSRTSSMRSFRDAYYAGEAGGSTASPRQSLDKRSPPSQHSVSRAPSLRGLPAPPNVMLSSDRDSQPFSTVLSPPPLHRTEIGRAVG